MVIKRGVKDSMKLNKVEIWHIRQVMRERGISHCQECKNIEKKLTKELNKLMDDDH